MRGRFAGLCRKVPGRANWSRTNTWSSRIDKFDWIMRSKYLSHHEPNGLGVQDVLTKCRLRGGLRCMHRMAPGPWSTPVTPTSWPRSSKAMPFSVAWRGSGGCGFTGDAGLNPVVRSGMLSSPCCTRVGRFDPKAVIPATISRVGKTVIARAEQVHLAEDPVAHAHY